MLKKTQIKKSKTITLNIYTKSKPKSTTLNLWSMTKSHAMNQKAPKGKLSLKLIK